MLMLHELLLTGASSSSSRLCYSSPRKQQQQLAAVRTTPSLLTHAWTRTCTTSTRLRQRPHRAPPSPRSHAFRPHPLRACSHEQPAPPRWPARHAAASPGPRTPPRRRSRAPRRHADDEIFQPWIQRRRLEYARHKHVMSGLLTHVQTHAFGRIFHDDGTPNVPVIEKLFHKIDLDNDGRIERGELKAFIVGVNFEDVDSDSNQAVDQIMADFDRSQNSSIEKGEFVNGISRWLEEARRSVADSGAHSKKLLHDFHQRTTEQSELPDNDDEGGEAAENSTWTWVKAILLLVLGTGMAAAFADPLVDTVHNFSSATNIPSFFISFIAMPLATNSSEAVSAIIFSSRKKQRTLSLTFSEIYGSVTMNNTLCLTVFLGLVYVRGLTWDFSSEVLIIFLICMIMGLFTSFRTTFPLWTSFVAFLMYPLSLIIVYVLDFKFGWS